MVYAKFLMAVLGFCLLQSAALGQDTRQVSENTVVSLEKPRIAIGITKDIPYIGRHPIKIRDVAAGERLVFADTDDGKIKRMLILQFEGFLPHVEDGQYRYNFSGRPEVAGYPFRSNAFSFDLEKTRAENPGNESASTAVFLEEQGLVPPKIWMMWRSLTAELPDRRDELIIFYVETGAGHNMTMADIYDPVTDNSTDEWRQIMVGLERRANASYALAPLSADKTPVNDAWETVPLLLSENE